jgi:hypothetical protein
VREVGGESGNKESRSIQSCIYIAGSFGCGLGYHGKDMFTCGSLTLQSNLNSCKHCVSENLEASLQVA